MKSRKPAAPVAPVVSGNRGLFLVTPETMAQATAAPDSLAHAKRIVAQVEWEVSQQAARERAERMRPVAVMPREVSTFEKLARAIGF